MEKYLNKGIKEVISEFPKVADILNDYAIGCVPCNVGTCLLKDIVEIHNLSPEEENELMAKIAKAIYPDRKIEIPKAKRKDRMTTREIKYSPPVKKLVDEHTLIKRWIDLIPAIVEAINLNFEEGKSIIKEGVDFIQSYADKYHHAKEEDILFKYFDEGLDIIKAMHSDHESARAHAKATLAGLEANDKEAVTEHLKAYRELLTEHIKKENDILYPWMDRNFSMTQIGKISSEFNAVDEKFGDAPSSRYELFVVNLEKKFK